jgi:hypothetical protein
MPYAVKFKTGEKERVLKAMASSLEEARTWSELQVKYLNKKTTGEKTVVDSITEISNADSDSP